MIGKRMLFVSVAVPFTIFIIFALFGVAGAVTAKPLGPYGFQFDLPEGYTIISDENVPEYLQKNIGLKYKNNTYYSLFMIITENLNPRIIDNQTRVQIINGFLIDKFKLDPNEPNIENTFCKCGKPSIPSCTYGAVNEAVKAEFSDDSSKKRYFAFQFYLVENNSSHIIVWTNSKPIVDYICDSLFVSLHTNGRNNA
jgi:hypothetical protein